MSFPLAQTVGLHVWSAGSDDGHGIAASVYTPSADQPGTSHAVYGWSVPSSDSPVLAGHDRVQVDIELLVPPEFPAKPRDLVDLPDGQYQIVGIVRDYATGPFEWVPGGVLNLQKVEG